MWKNHRTSGDPDPIVYLAPVGVLGVAGSLSQTVEDVLNCIIGWGALVLAFGTAGYIAWAIWWPLPGLDGDEPARGAGWNIPRNNISRIFTALARAGRE